MTSTATKTEWRETTLGAIVKIRQGRYINDQIISPRREGQRANAVFGGNGIRGYTEDFEYEDKQTLITCRGSGCGLVQRTEPRSSITNSSIALEVGDGVDSDFIYYWALNTNFSDVTSGSAQPQITIGALSTKNVCLPPVDEQRSIAAILASLDNKRELLQKQNKTLEQIAQVVFNEWFVKPATDGKLPEGWRIGRLADIATVDWGNTNLTKSSYTPVGQYLGVSAAGADGRMTHAEHEVGTTVLSAIGEYAGRIFYPTEPFTAIKNTITVSPIPNVSRAWFIHQTLVNHQIPRRGAAQPFLSKGDTEAYSVIIPPHDFLENVDGLFSSIETKQRNNTMEIQTLASIRDALLPRLMNGEIKV